MTVFAIGVGSGVDMDILIALAEGRDPHTTSSLPEEHLFEACGGKAFYVDTAADFKAIFQNAYFDGCHSALRDLTITGPDTGLIQSSYTFSATLAPLFSPEPITYVWQTAGQPPITHTSELSDQAAFFWSTPGTYTVSVTASNAGGALSETQTIIVSDASPPPPEKKTYLPIIWKDKVLRK